jgi:hypothetical protein
VHGASQHYSAEQRGCLKESLLSVFAACGENIFALASS